MFIVSADGTGRGIQGVRVLQYLCVFLGCCLLCGHHSLSEITGTVTVTVTKTTFNKLLLDSLCWLFGHICRLYTIGYNDCCLSSENKSPGPQINAKLNCKANYKIRFSIFEPFLMRLAPKLAKNLLWIRCTSCKTVHQNKYKKKYKKSYNSPTFIFM